MKYTKYIALSILLFFTLIVVAFAAGNGACSYHGGVKCSVKFSSGMAMCNDGWESSVPYSSVAECKSSCVYPSAYKYTSENQCRGLMLLNVQNGSAQYTPDLASGAVYACRGEVSRYQEALSAYNSCLRSTSTPVIYTTRNTLGSSVSTRTCLINSTYSNALSKCVCNVGYTLFGNQCRTDAEVKIEIGKITDEVRNMTPEQEQKSEEEACRYNKELAKNDPVAFEKYKKDLASLGIQMSNCDGGKKVDPGTKKETTNYKLDISEKENSTVPILVAENAKPKTNFQVWGEKISLFFRRIFR